MAVTTITGVIQNPTGAPLPRIRVVATLNPRPAFITATGVEIPASAETLTDLTGQYSFSLQRTADITPAGSYYTITEYIPDRYGGAVKHSIQVSATPSTVYAALVSVPPSSQAAVFLTQDAADARYVQTSGGFALLPSPSRPGDAAAAGIQNAYSRGDHTHQRETSYGSSADRLALAGSDLYNGLTFFENNTASRYVYRGAATGWLRLADNYVVADATARNAILAPQKGSTAHELDTNRTYTYDGNFWKLESFGANRPRFRRAGGGAGQSIPAATNTLVTFVNGTEDFDSDSVLATNGVFTCTAALAGWWTFEYNVLSNNNMAAWIQHSAGTRRYGNTNSSNLSASHTFQVGAGETVAIYAFAGAASTINANNGATFSGYYQGPA